MLLPRSFSHSSGVIPLELIRENERYRAALAYTFRSLEEDEKRLRALLSPEEAAVAARYQHPRRLSSYLLGRSCAKEALSPLLEEPDLTRITIASGVFGQPLVRYHSLSERRFDVSLTHWEGGAAALAFPDGHPMGIDGEAPNPLRLDTMAAILTPQEADWTAASPLLRTTAAWTAREALSKVLRCGLMVPLEFLAITPPAGTESSGVKEMLEGRYTHFTQYRFVTIQHAQAILSICLPRHSSLQSEPVRAD